jgi:hypothetical protein
MMRMPLRQAVHLFVITASSRISLCGTSISAALHWRKGALNFLQLEVGSLQLFYAASCVRGSCTAAAAAAAAAAGRPAPHAEHAK